MNKHLDLYRDFFENLSVDNLDSIEMLFAPDAVFKDPFNCVRGHAAIRRIFEHLLREYPKTEFKIVESVEVNNIAYLQWYFRPDSTKSLEIEGVSRVQLSGSGEVLLHQDYWDSMSELYVKIPVVGSVANWLLRRSQACSEDQIVKD